MNLPARWSGPKSIPEVVDLIVDPPLLHDWRERRAQREAFEIKAKKSHGSRPNVKYDDGFKIVHPMKTVEFRRLQRGELVAEWRVKDQLFEHLQLYDVTASKGDPTSAPIQIERHALPGVGSDSRHRLRLPRLHESHFEFGKREKKTEYFNVQVWMPGKSPIKSGLRVIPRTIGRPKGTGEVDTRPLKEMKRLINAGAPNPTRAAKQVIEGGKVVVAGGGNYDSKVRRLVRKYRQLHGAK